MSGSQDSRLLDVREGLTEDWTETPILSPMKCPDIFSRTHGLPRYSCVQGSWMLCPWTDDAAATVAALAEWILD
jgi:hypothetical protein